MLVSLTSVSKWFRKSKARRGNSPGIEQSSLGRYELIIIAALFPENKNVSGFGSDFLQFLDRIGCCYSSII